MPLVTALSGAGRDRVVVELDGSPWQALPAAVVVRARLRVGMVADRATFRLVRRELRRVEASRVATRALAAHDRSAQSIDARLERAGFARGIRSETIEELERSGALDDARFARRRAELLAERGYGDAAIRADLGRAGLAGELAAEAIAELAPERDRALAVVRKRGPGARTRRYLAARGFDEEAVAAAWPASFASDS